jgi:hypothetical protein
MPELTGWIYVCTMSKWIEPLLVLFTNSVIKKWNFGFDALAACYHMFVPGKGIHPPFPEVLGRIIFNIPCFLRLFITIEEPSTEIGSI